MSHPKAFLSYSSIDKPLVEQLASDLRKNGVDAWFDKWEIKPGDSIRRKIDQGIDEADVFFVVLTPNSLKSEWVQTELDAGLVKKIQGECRLIPVLNGINYSDLPPILESLHGIDMADYETALQDLLMACHGASKKPPIGEAPTFDADPDLSVPHIVKLLDKLPPPAAKTNMLSEEIKEKIRHFKDDRLSKILSEETPVPLDSKTLVALHIIPAISFDPMFQLNLTTINEDPSSNLNTFGVGSQNWNYNADGFIHSGIIHGSQRNINYTQVFRSGIIEAVSSSLVRGHEDFIPSTDFVNKLITGVNQLKRTLQNLAVPPPAVISLSLLGVKEKRLGLRFPSPFNQRTIDRENLFLPDHLLNNWEEEAKTLLRPIFDVVWQACGFAACHFYDADGNWIGEQ